MTNIEFHLIFICFYYTVQYVLLYTREKVLNRIYILIIIIHLLIKLLFIISWTVDINLPISTYILSDDRTENIDLKLIVTLCPYFMFSTRAFDLKFDFLHIYF